MRQSIKILSQEIIRDTHREISPLQKTEDAIEIDTSNLTIDEVVSKVLEIVE